MPEVTLFLCGDVMTGRGVDQILPHPVMPHLYEGYVRSAVEYVEIAERVSGRIARRVPYAYVWGDALGELERRKPDARIVNLETAVTTSEDAWPDKGIHYRMHPANIGCLTAAKLDCCVLANNHVLDWGRGGLDETLQRLHEAGMRTAGAGVDAEAANAPAVIELAAGPRLLVYARATTSSGVPPSWAATAGRCGVALLTDLSAKRVDELAGRVAAAKQRGDLVVVSLHWGENWDYAVTRAERAYAHAIVDHAQVDLVHGHSSHHVKGVEIYRGTPILYGCGDFLNDYEGIGGRTEYLPHVSLMYFATFADGGLAELRAVPTCIRRFQVRHASAEDTLALHAVLERECTLLDTAVGLETDGTLVFRAAA